MLASARGALLWALLASLYAASARTEEKPAAQEAQVRQWIEQLGDDSYEVRERAEANLLKAGRAALPFLRQAAEDRNTALEPKVRIQRLRDKLLLWDGRESVAAYALLAGLKATDSLALGNDVTMELVLIPAGQFLMGSPETEEGRENGETQHEVTISKPYYLGKYEVTQEQYEAVVGKNPSSLKGAKNPVEMVVWDEAQEFCKKLAQKTGRPVRLPTEAEWEYACRAGTTTPFHTGNTIGAGQANYDSRCVYGEGNQGRYLEKTTPVGSFKPNAFGLHDMHANVWEWCADWYGPYGKEAVRDPTGPREGATRVIRGGAWGSDPRHCRSAFRRDHPDGRFNYIGLRVALDTK